MISSKKSNRKKVATPFYVFQTNAINVRTAINPHRTIHFATLEFLEYKEAATIPKEA